MKVLHVVPAYFPATHFGGPILSTLGLCDALQHIPGVKLRVLTTDAAGPGKLDRVRVERIPVVFPAGYLVYYCPRSFGLAFSVGLLARLWGMLRWADVVHLTGVYSPPTIPTLLICRLLGKPIVWSPRGSLQRWAQGSRLMLKSVWEILCNALVVSGRCTLHVTSAHEGTVSVTRISKATTTMIPNGVNLPLHIAERVWCPDGILRVLFIGRLHPIKGIENLLGALAKVGTGDFRLTVCGEGDADYSAELLRLVSELGLAERVSFQGHVDDDAKSTAFEHADVCVLPSFSENFGMVVAEALAHGVPVIVSKGAPWASVEAQGCGLWVENTPIELSVALQTIRTQDLAGMGNRGRLWMERDFGWPNVAKKMHALYGNLIAGTNR